MEIDFGDHTWMTRAEIAAHPQAPQPGLSWEDWDYVPPDGESRAGVHERVGRFLQTLSRDAVIVTHYGPARTIRAHYLDLAPAQAIKHRQAHTEILRLPACAETVFHV